MNNQINENHICTYVQKRTEGLVTALDVKTSKDAPVIFYTLSAPNAKYYRTGVIFDTFEEGMENVKVSLDDFLDANPEVSRSIIATKSVQSARFNSQMWIITMLVVLTLGYFLGTL